MKTKALLFIAGSFIPSLGLHAQFDALPETDASWAITFWIGPGYPYQGIYYEFNSSSPDTIYNGEVFKKLIARYSYGGVISDPVYGGAILDNEMGQVYFWQNNVADPYLLYDFDVSVGDTVPAQLPGVGIQGFIVVSVDTIDINGTDRKRIGVQDLSGQGNTDHWIQGIGGSRGFDYTCGCLSVSGMGDLSCMTLNGTVEWGNNVGGTGDCEILLSLAEQSNAEPLFFEGPIGVYSIDHANAFAARWEIMDLNGKMIDRSSGASIDLRGNRPGLYLLHVELDGNHFTQKLMFVE